MEADVGGLQRKVVASIVRPLHPSHGASGIPLRGGGTLPFVVRRSWSAPAGHYAETWYLVNPATREVLYQSSDREVRIWGLQSWTDFGDAVTERLPLLPGEYLIVFALGGAKGGEVVVSAFDAIEDAA
ncbi:MAG: hypothetical protein M3P18_20790 [Actinomycetota bacterium]|nr:hypothetical protein [Actinomycetota bacterium]